MNRLTPSVRKLGKLAIIVTHPIQYYVPVFQFLVKQSELKVFYTWGKSGAEPKYDPDFRKSIEWDIPLLEGYDYEFLENQAKNPGSHHFQGIKNNKIKERIKAFNPDAILIYGWAYSSHLKILREFNGKIPIWFRGDSTLLNNRPGLKSLIKSIWLKWVYSHVDVAFNVGSANKAYFENYGLKKQQLIWAPHSVDNKRFAENFSREALALRTELGIVSNATLILFAGKLQEQKNPEILLRAFEKLNASDTHLLFVGNGALEQRLKELTNNSAMKSQITFLDFQNQKKMPVIYQACDVYCLCSNSETWGLAVNEAMAAGRAILVSDQVGCAIDLVKNSENGFIFKSNDIADLTKKLNLLKNKSTLQQMGEASKKIISRWSIEKQVESILTAFQ